MRMMQQAMQALFSLLGGNGQQHHELSQQLAASSKRLEDAADKVVESAREEEPLTKLARDMKGRRQRKASK